jgi:hypothetical protein
MRDVVYADKDCQTEFGSSDHQFRFSLSKPMLCPYCEAFEDGVRNSSCLFNLGSNEYFGVVSYSCSHCKKRYLVVYKISPNKKTTEVASIVPSIHQNYENKTIAGVSPRFIEIYNQALLAENSGSLELAAIGYRAALEILVKDFAVQELKKQTDEVIKKSLCTAIGEYLEQQELVASADVVRILGNDYAHYERKYPEHDFDLLKRYMGLFIKLVETKLLLAHPPVSR